MREIRFVFLESGISAAAALLEDKAPRTCAALWEQLAEPLELTGTHAMWTGPEVSMQIPPGLARTELSELPPENLTVFPQPGALLWACMPAYAFGGHPEPIFDIGLFYGPQGRLFLPMGWVPCNHFAQLQGDWDAFQDACRRTRTEGAQRLRLER
ncbi:MAG: DUF3830 family protein [Acidobacteriota bacterium]